MTVAFRTGLRLRASKPGGAFQEIDWGHPLAIGLRAYVPLTEGRGVPMELVSRARADNAALAFVEDPTSSQNGWVGARSTLGLGAQYGGGRFLLPVWFGGLTSNAGLQWTPAATDLTNTLEGTQAQYTAAVILSWNQLLGGGLGAAFGRLDLSFGWGIGVNSSHIPQWRVGGGLNLATTTTAVTAGQVYALIGRLRFPAMDIRAINLVTGVVETGTHTFASSTNSPTSAALNLVERGSSTNDRASAAVAAFWKRALSDEEIDAWLDNPWALLTATGARRWFIPGPPPPAPGAALPAIIRRRQSIYPPTKPTNPRLQVDWQNPLTQGLFICVPFFEGLGAPYDYARQVKLTANGAPAWGASSGSLGGRTRAATDFWDCGTNGTDFVVPRLRCTALVIKAKIDTTLRAACMFGNNNVDGDVSAFAVQLFTSPNRATWRWGNNTLQSVTGRYLPIREAESWAFVAGPQEGMKMYQNGLDVGSSATAAVERAEGVGEAVYLNKVVNVGAVNGDLCDYIFFALLDAEWSAGQVRSWARDPWQFFKPIPARAAQRPFVSLGPPAAYVSGESRVGDRSYTPVPYHRLERQKPARGAVINWRDPLAYGLRSYVPFLELAGTGIANGIQVTDLVSRTTARVFGFPSASPSVANRPSPPSRTGQGYLNNTGGSGAFQFNNDPGLQIHDALGWTIAFKYRCPTIPNVAGSPAFLAKDQPAFRHWRFNGVLTSGVMQFLVGTGAAGNIATTGVYTGTDAWYTVVGFAGSGGPAELEIYDESGILLERVVGSGIPSGVSLSSTSNINIGQGQSDLCVEWFGVWRGRLSTGQRVDLALRPYRLLVPRPTQQSVLQVVTAPSIISPSGIASEEAFGDAIVQGAISPSGVATAEAFGVDALVDVATTVSPSGLASAEFFGSAELIDGVGAAGTVDLDAAHDGVATAEAFGTAAVREEPTIRPTGIPSAEDMDNPTVEAPVGTIQPFGIASEEAFTEPSTGGLSGTTVFTLTNPTPPLAGTVTAKKLCSPMDLKRAEIFAGAPDPAFILPDVYGDFSVGGLRGPIPTVCISTASPWIYVAAAHPVQSIDKVYVDDVEQTAGFAMSPAIDIGAGQMAVIAFADQPAGQVTWRGKGRMDDAGVLITNPVSQLERVLKDRCGYFDEDFDAGPLAEAKAAAAAAGWTLAWVFADDRQIQDWVTEVMFNVMGFWRVTGNAKLQLTLDPGAHFATADIVESVVAARDCVDGDDGVAFVADRQHLVNKLEAFYLYSWSLQGPSSRLTDLNDEVSQNAYGELRKSVTLRGHRDSAQVSTWADILFARQGFDRRVEGATVSFTVKGSKLAHATIGDLIAFSWPYGPTRESGNAYVNQILRILTISQDFSRGGASTVTAVDTGDYVTLGGARQTYPFVM